MGDVIDYFSGKSMQRIAVKDDPEKNAHDAETKGKYVGVLPKHEANVMRQTIEQMRQKRGQIEALMKEFEAIWEGYSYMLLGAATMLGISDRFDPNTQDLLIDKEGHCWLIPSDSPSNWDNIVALGKPAE